MQVGRAAAEPGEVATGWFEAAEHPTGGTERLPVTVVNGAEPGPTLWLVGGVHGDEATGVATVQDAAAALDPAAVSGAVVCVPVVNPAGLRRNVRESYYGDDDPNRQFPDPAGEERTRPPEVQERIDERLYDAFADSADALVDLHTAGVGSTPFVIRDRVLYGERRSREEAAALSEELAALADAFGFPVMTEYPAAEYLDESLQRSVAGAALNAAGVPAFTAELGGHSVVEEDVRAAGVAGVLAVAAELGVLDAVPDDAPDASVPPAPVEFPVRRFVGPRTETAGLVRHRVEAGDVVEAGDAVADVVTPHGDRLATVDSEHDGYVVGRAEGLAAYEGDAVARMAVRDDGPLVVPREDEEDEEDEEGTNGAS
jgi:hypothetical protein